MHGFTKGVGVDVLYLLINDILEYNPPHMRSNFKCNPGPIKKFYGIDYRSADSSPWLLRSYFRQRFCASQNALANIIQRIKGRWHTHAKRKTIFNIEPNGKCKDGKDLLMFEHQAILTLEGKKWLGYHYFQLLFNSDLNKHFPWRYHQTVFVEKYLTFCKCGHCGSWKILLSWPNLTYNHLVLLGAP